MSTRDNYLFDFLMSHLDCECEIWLVRGEPINGRIINFNKNPLTLQVKAESLHLINFSQVVQIIFAKSRERLANVSAK